MRSSVARPSLPWRSSERNRAYARSAAGDPARTPRKFGSCPPVASAPLRMGSDPSGAVRSSWIWNLLLIAWRFRGTALTFSCCLRCVRVAAARCTSKRSLLLIRTAVSGVSVGACDGDDDQQEPEQERPQGDPVGVAAVALDGAARRAP